MKTQAILWIAFIGWFVAIDYLPNSLWAYSPWLVLGILIALAIDNAHRSWRMRCRQDRW